jgi:monoamine oxidase
MFNSWFLLQRETGVPMLLGFASGHAAVHFERQCTDEQVRDEAMAALRRLFPGAPLPVGFRFARWLGDGWSAGGYSYPAVGSPPEDRMAYAQPLGDRVFFAGEATEGADYGTVQAALRSGERAAEAIFRHVVGGAPSRVRRPWRHRDPQIAGL